MISSPDHLARAQASAYDRLHSTYEASHEMLQPIRARVLDNVLVGLERGATVLEVGCGHGASLAMFAERGFSAQGVELSTAMARAARSRSRCSVIEGDFRAQRYETTFDLIFAQAFIHLFPKADAEAIIRRMQSICARRIYLSTSLCSASTEGWERKHGIERYRSRYTKDEFLALISRCVDASWTSTHFELHDPLCKHWLNVILERG